MKTTLCRGPEYHFLKEMFRRLRIARVRYAVMRNYETLPFNAGGSDLDLWIARECGVTAKIVLKKTIQHSGGAITGCSESPGFIKWMIIGCAKHLWWGLTIDMNIGLQHKGAMTILDDSKLSRYIKNYHGIAVFQPNLAAVLGVLKEVMNNNCIPSKYIVPAQMAANDEWNDISKSISPMGQKAAEILRDIIKDGVSNHRLLRKARELRIAVYMYSLLHRPLQFLMMQLRYEWSKIRRFIHPSGIVAAILGVDGVGKSTVIESIMPVLAAAAHNELYIKHLRPGLLPPLAKLKGSNAEKVGPVLNPHGSKQSGVFGSIVRMIYLLLDYVLGYWILVRPKISKNPAIILYDRYAYDMAIDPRRFRLSLSGNMISWFMKIAPRPDIMICLIAPPKIIVKRKHELPLKEIVRQIAVLKEFAKKESKAMLISTRYSRSKVKDIVLSLLLTFFKQRNDES